MNETLVESVLRATYRLAGGDATRLRRLTRQSGLEAENILSRLAIVRSIASGRAGPHANQKPSQTGRVKEIKGSVLLGRPRQAALILALLAHADREGLEDPRVALTWHWARGLRILDDESLNGDVLHALAEQFAAQASAPPTNRARRGGLSSSVRDELAAVVGRRFPRWATEVRRLVAMAARLDPDLVDSVAERFAVEAERLEPGVMLTEGLALRILQENWGVNRLGLNAKDRATLERLLTGQPVSADEPAVPFLAALGLVRLDDSVVRLSAMARRLGEEAMHP